MRLKLLRKDQFKKTIEATVGLIGHKVANKIKGGSQNTQQNNSETVAIENDKKILKERYISQEKRQKIINNLRSVIIA